MRIDHVIVAATDLGAAAARLEGEYGLHALGGGRHEGLGTHNRIVPLGGGYWRSWRLPMPRRRHGRRSGGRWRRVLRVPARG